MNKGNVSLLTVTHDKLGKNTELLIKYSRLLKSIYNNMYITVSDESDKKLVDKLSENGFKVNIIPKLGAAHARREVVKFGLNSEDNYFHYCDFDRLLTWVDNFPTELEGIVSNIPKYDYLIIGRTERAFKTHPIHWIETEKITNKITSIELNQEVDVTAGSCAFTKAVAQLIADYSAAKMTDAEWPMIVKRLGKLTVDYCEVQGLLYIEDINFEKKQGSEARDWFSRLRLSYIISESAINTLVENDKDAN